MEIGVAGLEGEGTPDQLGPTLRLPALAADHAEHVEGLGVPRLLTQDLAV